MLSQLAVFPFEFCSQRVCFASKRSAHRRTIAESRLRSHESWCGKCRTSTLEFDVASNISFDIRNDDGMNYHRLASTLSFLLLFAASCSLTLKQTSEASRADAVRVVWFREHALRVRDNDALDAAMAASAAPQNKIVPVYLWKSFNSLSFIDISTGGTASDVFVANALDHLNQTLCCGLSLGMVEPSDAHDVQALLYAEELAHVCKVVGASEMYYMESHDCEFEEALRRNLHDNGLLPVSFRGGYSLIDYSSKDKQLPWKEIIEKHPFRSPLIPFVDYLLERLEQNPPGTPKPRPLGLEESIMSTLSSLGDSKSNNEITVTKPLAVSDLKNAIGYTKIRNHWGSSIVSAWPASEEDAASALEFFLDSLPQASSIKSSKENSEENPSFKQTHLASRLSPYLARGLLSPRQVYHALLSSNAKEKASFTRRICWRDYTYAVLSLFPDVVSGKPIREGYDTNLDNKLDETETNRRLFQLWKDGATGFPLVDAGMRQLAVEGWMPQKVRLSVSTCLVEGLGGSWKQGMDHFAEYLVDYDPAINTNMWMNAGCVGFDPYYVGTDYKRRPYWDKAGDYVRKWCPELQNLPDACELPEAQRGIGTFKVDCLYEPWLAPKHVLHTAGVVLGETYPNRCCDERSERKRFFESMRNQRSTWASSDTDERGRDMVRLGRGPSCESIGMFTPKALLVGKSKRPRH